MMAISDWFKTPESDETDLFRRSRPTKAQREAIHSYLEIPVFPWDTSICALIDQHNQFVMAFPDAGSKERKAESFMFDIQTTLNLIAYVDDLDPLSGALLARPLAFVEPTVDNSQFSDVESDLLQKYEANSIVSWPTLLLEGHIKAPSGPGQLPQFRPSGSTTHYQVVSDCLITFGTRVVALVVALVTEGRRGPEIMLDILNTNDCTDYNSATYRKLPGASLAESIHFFNQLDRAFCNLRIPGVSYESWVELEQDYDYLIRRSSLIGDSHLREWQDRDARFEEILNAAIPGTRMPGSRQIFEPMQIDGGADVGSSLRLPSPRLIKTPRDAEIYAAEVMEATGFTNVVPTGLGADGGIDVESTEAIAQVKLEGRRSSREQLQRLYGIAAHRDVLALFFSLGGYSAQAIQWAEETGMHLFEFEFDGTVIPRSSLAKQLFRMS
ncbi:MULTISPECIES: restriction endonuclease [unclassified Brevibacterium]|uniref:restriction endonuclease n=1 Tax=unclassified Brevibacterium TaxID=2614124 RepID=UPI001E4EBD90|nr:MULTISPECIES: restriction endonuclease [unclassified Brevibacterium]MCD1287801.1 hypothetical protein [Brevibacterium sp. CCUG 69071]MDK8435090.1 restriction endonuclease [Brevibacterium sp. H-BE7]